MSRHRPVLAFAGTLVALVASVTPARADFVQMQYFGFYGTGARGLVTAERPRNPDAATRVYVALAKLMPGRDYELIASSDPCATPNEEAHELFTRAVTAKPDGSAFLKLFVAQHYVDFLATRSLRLLDEEGIYYFCRPANSTSAAGRSMPDGANAHFMKNGYRGSVLIHDSGPGRITTLVSLNKLGENVRYRLVHSPLTCREFLEGDPDQPIVIGRFRSNANGLAVYEREEEAEIVDAAAEGSYRIERRGSGAVWGCANLGAFIDD